MSEQASRLPGLVSIEELSYAQAVSIAIYGPAGVGKTTLAFSFPTKSRRFAFDFEAGLRVVKNVRDTDVYRAVTYQQLNAGIDFLEKDIEHDTVIVDSATELGRVVQLNSVASNPSARPHPELTTMQDFYLTVERMRNITRRIRLLIQKGKTVIFTLAETVEKDANTGRLIGVPELPGKQLGAELCYLMDEVYRMTPGSAQGEAGQRFIVTQPDSIFTSKTRVPNAPARILVPKDNPSKAFEHIMKG